MAEVLAPIIQQSGSMTMLHNPSDTYQKNNSPQSHHNHSSSHGSRSPQMPRTHNQTASSGYRGTSAAPVAPYAFSATPQLQHRTAQAAPVQPGNQRQWQAHHASSASDSTASTASSARSHHGVREDSVPSSQTSTSSKTGDDPTKRPLELRPTSALFSSSVPDLSLGTFDATAKASPDRYRRNVRRTDSSNSTTSQSQVVNRSAVPSGSGMANVAHLYNLNAPQPILRPAHQRAGSVDDLQVSRQSNSEQAKRYRRRSVGGFDADVLTNAPQFTSPTTERPSANRQESHESRTTLKPDRPASHSRQGSGESASSNRPSSRASASSRKDQARPSSSAGHSPAASPRAEGKNINIPPRGSSDASKRLAPSPLSKPMTPADAEPTKPTTPNNDASPSPAVQRLAAINDGKAEPKNMKSRLRRAFSFGSAAELRRASAENNLTNERARLQKQNPQDEIDPEDAAIIAKQEAAGIGAGIYSGQGGFAGSTDNLSISSTASSASIMLRKMGKGMKKGGRSIKGLFRPKSVIGVPAADTAVTQPSLAQVSMVTVEAERDRVNVNVDPHEHAGGGTGFPKLERNSMEATLSTEPTRPASQRGSDSLTRKSILGGDRERAEVLAGIKKGILKRTPTAGEGSPVIRPMDGNQHADTPASSAPSTPKDDNMRSPSLPLAEDYFNGLPKFGNSSTKSLPNTPSSSRNVSFSPRIQSHDAWSSTEYDRRGDIATCNRLTPMLAQQIKEELNSFKMEMEVHELSKPHTHFF